jgi:hypothetical protein
MKMIVRSVFSLLIFVSVATGPGCQKEDQYPVTPEIEFKSLDIYKNVSGLDSLELIFSFTDGDGDLGTPEIDLANRDIFVKIFELRNGVFVEPVLPAPLEYKLPYLEPRGNNKSLKGDIKLNVDYNITYPNDTIRYSLYIKDRAGHQSNTITTTTIVTNIQ